jgi:mannosyltransferase OCH1-like enzyme
MQPVKSIKGAPVMIKKVVGFFVLVTLRVLGITSFKDAMDEGYTPSVYKNCSRFERYYESNHYESKIPSEIPLIPKILHQIWIGSSVPEKFKSLMEGWKAMHPEWEYKLWTDETICELEEINEAFFRASNIGSKADILRYVILFKYGGVYVDVDFECIKPLDPFIYAHEFFAGIAGYDYIGNAIIGSKKNHPIFKKLLTIIDSWDNFQLQNPWIHTGPQIFTKQLYQFFKQDPEKYGIYPTRFFHPFPNNYRFQYWSGGIQRAFIESFFIKETFAVHHWAESWNH